MVFLFTFIFTVAEQLRILLLLQKKRIKILVFSMDSANLNISSNICFPRYDSFTGVPVCQQNLLLEKASVLFNIGALYTQLGTRCNRQTQAGLENAVDAFQKAAGTHLKILESSSHNYFESHSDVVRIFAFLTELITQKRRNRNIQEV